MDKFLVLFTSDLHGNKVQYEKLFNEAIEERANAIILGGDLTPKDSKNRTMEGQENFLKTFLIPRMEKLFSESKCKIFAILGNDDFKENENVLKKFSNVNKKFNLIHKRFVKLPNGFKIFGYPFVPPTPFKYKDWEKLDTATNMDKIREPFSLNGIKNKGSIKDDLEKASSKVNSKTILVFHTPPYGTVLDMIKNKSHVGSIALRKFLEGNRGFISLHGHIHETVDTSGRFIDNVGKNTCVAVGNDNNSNKLSVIRLDLLNPNKIERGII